MRFLCRNWKRLVNWLNWCLFYVSSVLPHADETEDVFTTYTTQKFDFWHQDFQNCQKWRSFAPFKKNYKYVCVRACMNACMNTCMYACMYVCVCMYVCMYVRTYMHTYIHTYMYVCVCVRGCMHVCVRSCVCACMYVYMLWIYVCNVCMFVCVCVRACVHGCMHAGSYVCR
jgi:hypothetical protein